MIKLVGYFLILSAVSAHALVPVEGIIMGEADETIQSDPLKRVFSDIYDTSQEGENKKLKLYYSTYMSGQNLVESCGYLGEPVYPDRWQEKQARRSVASTLQYIGLDTSIKAIGAYAKKLDVDEDEFNKLTDNLVGNYCSQNITIFSLRNIRKSLKYYYDHPEMDLIPSVKTSPFATQMVINSTEKPEARSREFDKVIKNFRAFCSWGGDVDDYRMMAPYLNNRYIMAFVFKNMAGLQDVIEPKEKKVIPKRSDDTVQVVCTDLICRKENRDVFKIKFPLTAGSTGIITDLSKMYCHHHRFQDLKSTIPEVKGWIKEMELEDPIFETSQFISLMTGVPDLFNGADSYTDVPLLVRSNIDERWTTWAKTVLSTFSRDLLYEESLKVKASPLRNTAELALGGFKVDFVITLGEMDRLLKVNDKLDMSFNLDLSKNYLRSLRSKIIQLENAVDMEGQKAFKNEVAQYIEIQLKQKEKLFTQKLWNDDFARLIAEELIEQAKIYNGSLFNSYRDEVLKVPVKFTYGLFALSYLRYRADVANGRLKLSL